MPGEDVPRKEEIRDEVSCFLRPIARRLRARPTSDSKSLRRPLKDREIQFAVEQGRAERWAPVGTRDHDTAHHAAVTRSAPFGHSVRLPQDWGRDPPASHRNSPARSFPTPLGTTGQAAGKTRMIGVKSTSGSRRTQAKFSLADSPAVRQFQLGKFSPETRVHWKRHRRVGPRKI